MKFHLSSDPANTQSARIAAAYRTVCGPIPPKTAACRVTCSGWNSIAPRSESEDRSSCGGFRPDHTTADRGLARPFFTGQFTTRDDGTRLDAGWDASLWPYAVARLPSVNLPPLLRWPREHPAPRETSWLCWAVIPIHGWQPFSFEFPAKNKDPSQGASARAPLG
jgi:hypothetical protein